MTIEELTQKNLELQEQLKTKDVEITSLNTLKTTLEETKTTLEKENNDLKAANMNLYLRVSQENIEVNNKNKDTITQKSKTVRTSPTSWDSFFDKK